MTLINFLLYLGIAALAGAIGQALARHSLGSLLTSILVGFAGAYLGPWIAGQFHFPNYLVVEAGGRSFPLFWAAAGAALLTLAIWPMIKRRRLL